MIRTLFRGVMGAFAFVFAIAAVAAPAPPPFRQVGVEDGLPSSRVTGLAFDHRGYLWIATRDGLARFDGIDYTVYRHLPGEPGSLPGNFVQTVFVDSTDRIWVGVEGQGLCTLQRARQAFRCFNQATQPLMKSDDVWAIAETPDGYLWFGSFGGGLYRLDRQQRLTRFLPLEGQGAGLPDENVLALAVDTRGVLWVGTTSGLARWSGSGFLPEADEALGGKLVSSLSPESGGALWIGTDHGVLLRHADGRIEQPAWRGGLPEGAVNSVLRDRDGNRWIATMHGLARERDGRVDRLPGTAASAASVTMSVQDRNGGLWFGSESFGLLRLPADWGRFTAFGAGNGADQLASAPVRGAALARDGRVWLADGSDRLSRFDPSSLHIEAVLDLGREIPGAKLWSVLEDREGLLWLGHSKGLSRYDPGTRGWRHWHRGAPGDPVLSGPVRQLALGGGGLVWLAAYGGGVQARDREGVIVHSFADGEGGVVSPEQAQLGAGPDGALWLAGPKGLRRWRAAAQRFEAVPGAPKGRVFAFALAPDGRFWLHRVGALERYRWQADALHPDLHFGASAGLPAVESGGLLVDRAGRAWLGTTRGLLRFDPGQRQWRNFGMRDGLPGQELHALAPLALPSGHALVSSNEALVLFDPMALPPRPTRATLVLDAVSLHRGERELSLPTDGRAVLLQPDDRDLRIEARLLSFGDPAANRYRFRLRGYEPRWIEAGADGQRVFSRLEPGSYSLQVQARGPEGGWSAPLGFPLRVLAPWWQRPWALGVWLALAALALFLAARAYRQRVRDRHADALREHRRQLADQGSEAKSRFLANLGHEIRTPMTGVLGMAELLQAGALEPQQRRRVQSIQRAGEHLLRLVNDALDLARIEAGKLALEHADFDLHELLEELAALLQPLAQARGLAFRLERAPGLPRWLRGDAGRVRQILLNLAGNAIKFTEAGSVSLHCSPGASGVLLEVRDTGGGMDEAQVARLFRRFEQAGGLSQAQRRGGTGLGLAICRELAEAMGGGIEVESEPGQGTRFRVALPLPEADAPPAARADARSAAPCASPGARVLVVEDDGTVAEVVVGLLEAQGYQAVHAPQALAALSELAQGDYALALLDLDLPGMDGFDLARILRVQAPGTALLALTARADAAAEPEAIAAGMHAFLRKPLTSGMLRQAIAEACAARDAGRELSAEAAG
jgi:signal transduction histidine kinase/ActR/RegA family two-component response regulator/sugar lactone lactonase YvrE